MLPSILSPLVESVSSSWLARNLAVSALTKRQLSTVLLPALIVLGFASKARMPGAEAAVATGVCVWVVAVVPVIAPVGVLVAAVVLADGVGVGVPEFGVSVAVGVLVGCGVDVDVAVGGIGVEVGGRVGSGVGVAVGANAVRVAATAVSIACAVAVRFGVLLGVGVWDVDAGGLALAGPRPIVARATGHEDTVAQPQLRVLDAVTGTWHLESAFEAEHLRQPLHGSAALPIAQSDGE